jgi:hypothetical protein
MFQQVNKVLVCIISIQYSNVMDISIHIYHPVILELPKPIASWMHTFDLTI